MEDTLTLTPEQIRAVTSHAGKAVRFTDPTSRDDYVLLRADVYDRIQDLVVGFDPSASYPALDRTFSEGWNDPAMDDYDHYEEVQR